MSGIAFLGQREPTSGTDNRLAELQSYMIGRPSRQFIIEYLKDKSTSIFVVSPAIYALGLGFLESSMTEDLIKTICTTHVNHAKDNLLQSDIIWLDVLANQKPIAVIQTICAFQTVPLPAVYLNVYWRDHIMTKNSVELFIAGYQNDENHQLDLDFLMALRDNIEDELVLKRRYLDIATQEYYQFVSQLSGQMNCSPMYKSHARPYSSLDELSHQGIISPAVAQAANMGFGVIYPLGIRRDCMNDLANDPDDVLYPFFVGICAALWNRARLDEQVHTSRNNYPTRRTNSTQQLTLWISSLKANLKYSKYQSTFYSKDSLRLL
jgi:hypothetical protein